MTTTIEKTDQDSLAVEGDVYPLTEFLQDFGDGLIKRVGEQNPPLYSQADPSRAALMAGLKRPPYPPQAECVQAICKLLVDEDEKAAILNAEMGTGKTIMGISVATILHYAGFERTLVLSPPHLVYKWRREILQTVPDAEVWILNGPDTLAKLIQLQAMTKKGKPTRPTFYILGRVRMRMGFNWRPAAIARPVHSVERVVKLDKTTERKVITVEFAACGSCGEFVLRPAEIEGHPPVRVLHREYAQSAKREECAHCDEPLWTLTHKKDEDVDPRAQTIQALKRLPTIGPKSAETLVRLFGQDKLREMLVDNVYEFVNLMDEDGELYFSDRQAARMERAFAKLEFSFGQGEYQPTEFIKRYLPKGTFGACVVDEGHEYKAASSAQGLAMATVVTQCEKVLLLTGTLMGGYADDLFYLLWRLLTPHFISDGFGINQRNSLSTAATNFMEVHGVLKEIITEKSGEAFKSSRGTKKTTSIKRAPGFSPQGIARYVLPYTCFLKLGEIGGDVLPAYNEHFVPVGMTPEQEATYQTSSRVLTDMMKKALLGGDNTLLGVVLNVLLRWPDTAFRDEEVIHPRQRELLHWIPPQFEPSDLLPKERELLRIAREAKARGRRTLAYTIYTGNHDLSRRYADILGHAGLKTAVLSARVKPNDREDWIADRVDRGVDAIVTNPELVKTGLDLLEFPTIAFMQTGYSVYTLMQASRRAWRIGQTEDCDTYYLGYEHTAQMECLKLMGSKMTVAMSTSGSMPTTGLDVLNQDGDSVEVALAKQLIAA